MRTGNVGDGGGATDEAVATGINVFESLVGASWFDLLVIVATGAAMYLVVLLLVRLIGLRSLSRISSFDFTVTIAIGAVVGSTVSSNQVALVEGAVALLVLLGLQAAVAHGRRRWTWLKAIENPPVLLLEDGAVLDENLRRVSVTRDELYAALRDAGVRRLDELRAVVLESTGSISVVRDDPDSEFDAELLGGVIGREGHRRG